MRVVRLSLLSLLVVGLLMAQSAAVGFQSVGPNVICELHGEHGDNPDAREGDAELLREALLATYDFLPEDLRAHARGATLVVNHNFLPGTKLYMGWGPEDDPEYRYPDRALYPEGTIKTNCSERCVQLLAFIRDELGGINEHDGARAYMLGFFVHEFTHELQYMEEPVRDLNSGLPEDVCPGGLCDEALIAETRVKIEYETAAFARHLEFINSEQIASLAADYSAAVARSPELFEDGAEHGLLGPGFGEYYMSSFGAMREAGGIVGAAATVYHGQYRVPELAWELHRLLEDGDSQASIQDIATEWLSFMDQGRGTTQLRGVGPYIALVEQRFGIDLARAITRPPTR